MNANGMLGMMAAVNELLGGRYFWITSVTTPMASDADDRAGQRTEPGRDHGGERRRHQGGHPGRRQPVGRGDQDAGQPGQHRADRPDAERRPGPGLVPDSEAIASESTDGPHPQPDVGEAQDDRARDERRTAGTRR